MKVTLPFILEQFQLKACKCSRVCLLLRLIRAEREVPCSALCSSQETTHTTGALRISGYPKFNKFPNQTMWQETRLFGVLMEWEVRRIFGESFTKLVCWHFAVGRFVYSTVLRFSGFVEFLTITTTMTTIYAEFKGLFTRNAFSSCPLLPPLLNVFFILSSE